MHDDHEIIRQLCARLGFLRSIRAALTVLTAGCFAWGVVVLALRAGWGYGRGMEQLWLLGGVGAILLISLAVALVLARRRRPNSSAVRALLDSHNHCGGLLMAEAQAELGPWRSRVGYLDAPRVRWRGGRSVLLAVAAAAFVAVAFVVPAKSALERGRRLDVTREIDKLTGQVEVLKDEKLIEPEQAKELTEKLEQVRAEARGEDPVKTWEALDHVRENVDQAAEQAAEQALAETEKLAKAAALAQALQEQREALSEQKLAEAMGELAELTKDAAEQSELVNQELSESAGEALKDLKTGGQLTSEELKRLAQALKESQGQLAEQLARLAEAGLIDPSLLEQAEALGAVDAEGLAEALGELGEGEGESVAGLLDQAAQGNKPGRGGVTRGRGDAAMIHGDPSSPEGLKFKEQALPPGSIASLKDNRLVQVSAADPSKAGKTEGSSGGGVDVVGGSGSAYTHSVMPRHKGAVKRYFERPERK